MNRKILVLLLLVLSLSFLLFSCKPSKDTTDNDSGNSDSAGGDNSGNDTPAEENPDAIFAPATPLNIIIGGGANYDLVYELQSAIFEKTNVVPNLSNKVLEDFSEHTIYIGRMESELSKKAYSLLESTVENAELDAGGDTAYVGYVFYVKRKSLR